MSLPQGFWPRVFFLIEMYGSSFLVGAFRTFVIALIGTAIGCLIGFVVGVVQTIPLEKNDPLWKKVILKIIRAILAIYVEVFRGTPMMVQSMFIFYGAMQYLGINLSMWAAGIFIVSINTGAYMAETVRGGILSIDKGQTEGAKAIGMNHVQTMTNIILPQALRNILPQIGNNLIINIKDTSVLSVIGVVELFFSSKSVAGTYYTYFEAFTIAMVIYLVMTVTCSFLLRLWESKMDGDSTYDLATTDILAHTSGLYRYPKKTEDFTND